MKLFQKILLITLSITTVVGVAALMSFANNSHKNNRCTGIDVTINSLSSDELLSPKIVKDQIYKHFGKLHEQKLKSIKVEEIMKFLNQNPYINYATAQLSLNGKLQVRIHQSQPIVRVINSKGDNFYLDTKGKMMPASFAFPVRVMVASGHIDADFVSGKSIFKPAPETQTKPSSLCDIFHLAKTIDADTNVKCMIEQCFVNSSGNMSLITKAGSHQIIFGDTTNCQSKLSNLITFYKYGLSKIGWDTYKTINLMYKNQVVCTKS